MAALTSAPEANRPAILLVEDSSVNRMVAQRLLGRLGYTCDAASDGEEAVVMAQKKAYQLVLMDIQMPEMDGFSAARRLRETLGPRSPYIVAVTGNTMPGDRERCMAAGMDDYLGKPVRLEALSRILDPRGRGAAA